MLESFSVTDTSKVGVVVSSGCFFNNVCFGGVGSLAAGTTRMQNPGLGKQARYLTSSRVNKNALSVWKDVFSLAEER